MLVQVEHEFDCEQLDLTVAQRLPETVVEVPAAQDGVQVQLICVQQVTWEPLGYVESMLELQVQLPIFVQLTPPPVTQHPCLVQSVHVLWVQCI